MLPARIFVTGAPGSKWSGIAQVLEQLEGVNTTDHNEHRNYSHSKYSGHRGAYFGEGMEFEAKLDAWYLDQAWTDKAGCKIIKSHEWSLRLKEIQNIFPEDWIMCVYRPELTAFDWWIEAGGFSITYPNYAAYKNNQGIIDAISLQNTKMIEWGADNVLWWSYFTPEWIEEQFGQSIDFDNRWNDVLVGLWKPLQHS